MLLIIAIAYEVVYGEEKGTSTTVTYPEREYVEVDEEKAEELIGDKISYEPLVKEVDGTTITVSSMVSDGNATFSFRFGDAGTSIYVDLDKSTDEKLYGYAYIANAFNNSGVSLVIDEYPCTFEEYTSAEGERCDEIMEGMTSNTYNIPIKSQVEKIEYISSEGGSLIISPLSIKIDMKKGLGEEVANGDPYSIYYTSVNYKNGLNYIVEEHESSMHACEVEINNSSYACGDLEKNLIYVFNRLVDVKDIESITINESTYTIK